MARTDPYVMPHERRVLTVREHPVTKLSKPAAISVLFFGLAVWVSVASSAGSLHLIFWAALLVTLANLLWRYFEWAMTYLILTNLRLIVVDGVLVRRMSMIPLVKVVDMNFERPIIGMLFNYGKLVVEGAHPGHPLRRIGCLPHIDEVYGTICSMLFSDPDDREAPE